MHGCKKRVMVAVDAANKLNGLLRVPYQIFSRVELVPVVLKRLAWSACLAAAVTGCVTTKSDRHPNPKFDKPVVGSILLIKQDFNLDAYVDDQAECRERATVTEVGNSTVPAVYYGGGGGLLGAFLVGLTIGIAEGIQRAETRVVRREILLSCLQNERGYSIVGLPKRLEAPLEEVKGDDRAQGQIILEFIESDDFDEFDEWKTVAAQDRLEIYRAHLARYPDGMFANLAERYVEYLQTNAEKIAPKREYLAAETSVFTMFGLGNAGWGKPARGNTESDTDCGIRETARVKVLVRAGLAQAVMSMNGRQTINLVGRVYEDGRFDLVGDWPLEDPVAVSGRLDERFGTTAIFRSAGSPRCSNRGSLYEVEEPVGVDWLGVPVLEVATLEAAIRSRAAGALGS